MQRCTISERPGWDRFVRSEGLPYIDTITPEGETVSYWREGIYYRLDQYEMQTLKTAAEQLFQMFIAAGNYVIEHNLFEKLGIPAWVVPAICELWKDAENPSNPARPNWYTPMLYGRFDLCPVLNAHGYVTGVKMFEYNSDTPTGMPEAGITQWNWFVDHGFRADSKVTQFNDLFDALAEGWKFEVRKFRRITGRPVRKIHFAYSCKEGSGEDKLNTAFMQEAAKVASEMLAKDGEPGFDTELIHMCEIERRGVMDDNGLPIGNQDFFVNDQKLEVVFKLYPWEWMLADEFGRIAVNNALRLDGTVWLEPLWKLMWSNKGILAVLWEMYHDKPEARYLLPTYFAGEEPEDFKAGGYVVKPLHGREGAGVVIYNGAQAIESGPEVHYPGDQDVHGRTVLQQLNPLPGYKDLSGRSQHPVFGVYTLEDEAVGLVIRESSGLITNNQSFCVPHLVTGVTLY